MSFPFVEVFLGLLAVYLVYSVWAGLDPRFPIAAALVLLVVTAVVDALGDTASANVLAEYVFFLLGAGVLLLLIDHVRESRASGRPADGLSGTTGAVASPPTDPGKGATPPSRDRLEDQPVPFVRAPRQEYDEDEPGSDRKPEWDEEEVAGGPPVERGDPVHGSRGGHDREGEVPPSRRAVGEEPELGGR